VAYPWSEIKGNQMSETETYTEEEEIQGEPVEDAKGLRAQLEAANAAKAEAEAKAVSLERKSALSEAGLSLNDTQKAALEAIHKGDWTPDSLKETATALGFGGVEQGQEAPVVPQQEVEAIARVASLGAGAEASQPSEELDRRMDAWGQLGQKGQLSDGEFFNEVVDTLGTDFFEQHQRKVIEKMNF